MSDALTILRELVAIDDLRRSLARANHHATRFPTDENYAVIDSLSTEIVRRSKAAWEAARGIVSGEAGQTPIFAEELARAHGTVICENGPDSQLEFSFKLGDVESLILDVLLRERGIDSPEGGETRSGSTAKPQEPGREAARPETGAGVEVPPPLPAGEAERPSFEQAVVIWMRARELCEHYHGFKERDDSVQCSHPGQRTDWCGLSSCPQLKWEADQHGVE